MTKSRTNSIYFVMSFRILKKIDFSDISLTYKQREAEKKELEKQLAKEKRKQPGLQLSHILAFLDYLRELPGTSEVKQKSLINIFVNSVHLYDDYYTIIFNAGNATLRSENIPFRSIENSLKYAVFQTFSGSDFDAFVPPTVYWTNTYFFSGGFAVKVIL